VPTRVGPTVARGFGTGTPVRTVKRGRESFSIGAAGQKKGQASAAGSKKTPVPFSDQAALGRERDGLRAVVGPELRTRLGKTTATHNGRSWCRWRYFFDPARFLFLAAAGFFFAGFALFAGFIFLGAVFFFPAFGAARRAAFAAGALGFFAADFGE
jgi:hypothetical protein